MPYEDDDHVFEDIVWNCFLTAFSADVSYADRLEALVEPSGGISLLLPAAVDDRDAAEAVRLSFLKACASAEPGTLRGQTLQSATRLNIFIAVPTHVYLL